jgi:pyrroloquinoline quinone biosynthesis protein E
MNSFFVPLIALEINNSCNQDCIFCYNHLPHQSVLVLNNYNKIRRVLKQVFSQAKVGSVTFTGGEPMLEPRLAELVLFAKMNNSLTTIISNGTLFNNENISNLRLVKNDLFQLPIHSVDSEVHDKMTGLRGSHSKSLSSISQLLKEGANVVAVIVITRMNSLDIDKTIEFIASLGVSQISVDRYNIGGKNKSNYSKILPDVGELRNAYSLINSTSKRLNLTISSNVCTPHCVINPANFPFIRFGNCPENPLHFPLTINIDGDLRVCNHSPVVAGNIFKQNISEIVKSQYVKSWDEKTPDFCNNCGLWKTCRGGCRAASEQMGGNNSMADPIIKNL